MTDDALERLKKRKRPTVEPRDTNAVPDVKLESQDTLIPSNQNTKQPKGRGTNRLNNIKTKASTMRLDSEVAQGLSELCYQERISREVMVEALFGYFLSHPESREEILADARQRNEERVELANRKRAETMIKRFSQGES